MKNSVKLNLYLLFFCVLFGISILSMVHDIRILNPNYDRWLYTSGDTQSEYAAWLYFRQTPLAQWPVSLNELNAGTWGRTLIFSAVPVIIAVPLKYILALASFEGTFQYQGFQILLSWTLFLFYTFKIFNLKFQDRVNSFLVSAVLLTSPTVVFRNLFPHFTFNLIWIIPACFYFYQQCKLTSKPSRVWGILVFVAGTWMPYFIIFPLGIWVSLVTTRYFLEKSQLRSMQSFGSLIRQELIAILWIMSGFFLLFIVNGFDSLLKSGGSGVGVCNSNFNSLINPNAGGSVSFSNFYSGFELSTNCQYEGFSFLGIPVISTLIIGFCVLLYNRGFRTGILQSLQNNFGLILVALIFIFVSFGGNFAFNNMNFNLLNLQGAAFFSTFRATGRFMMLPAMAVSFFVFYAIFFVLVKKKIIRFIGLTILLLISFSDQAKAIQQIKLKESSEYSYGVDFEEIFKKSQAKKIEFLLPESSAYSWKMPLILAAAHSNLSVNDGFFARPDYVRLDLERERMLKKLTTLSFESEVLYVAYPGVLDGYVEKLTREAKYCIEDIEEKASVFWIGTCS